MNLFEKLSAKIRAALRRPAVGHRAHLSDTEFGLAPPEAAHTGQDASPKHADSDLTQASSEGVLQTSSNIRDVGTLPAYPHPVVQDRQPMASGRLTVPLAPEYDTVGVNLNKRSGPPEDGGGLRKKTRYADPQDAVADDRQYGTPGTSSSKRFSPDQDGDNSRKKPRYADPQDPEDFPAVAANTPQVHAALSGWGARNMGPNEAASNPFSFEDMRGALGDIVGPVDLRSPHAATDVGPSSHAGHSHSAAFYQSGGGTYGKRLNEQARLGIKNRIRAIWESEHILGVSVVHPGSGRTLENDMPAYYEGMHLHQENAGSGDYHRALDWNVHGGWPTTGKFREDQREMLRADTNTVSDESTSVSSACQLTVLSYGNILAAERSGLSRPHTFPDYIGPGGALPPSYYASERQATDRPPWGNAPASESIATNSYNNMVRHDPPVVHRLNGYEQKLRLGPRGQAEALLARQAAISGEWPDNDAIARVSKEVLPPPVYAEKQRTWGAEAGNATNPLPPPYRSRDRQQTAGR